MSTKEQEMEALQKIKEILSGIDPDGYVATALDGCLEIAEDNIGNDFLCSMKQRADSATDEANAYRELSEKYKKIVSHTKRKMSSWNFESQKMVKIILPLC